jgi:hypothetical protein
VAHSRNRISLTVLYRAFYEAVGVKCKLFFFFLVGSRAPCTSGLRATFFAIGFRFWLMTSLSEPFFVALQTGGFTVGTPARSGDGRRLPSIRVGLPADAPESVFAHWRSVEAWYRDGPSLLRWRLRTPGTTSGRPDQSTTRRNRRSTRIARDLLQPAGSTQGILVLPGEAESGSAGVQPDEE